MILMPDGHVVASFVCVLCCVVLCCVVLCCGLVAGGWREVHFITLKKPGLAHTQRTNGAR